MDGQVMNPQGLAYLTIQKMQEKGLAKGHIEDAWKTEPKTMHIQKAARHCMTALLVMEHPDFCKDPETYREHLEQALCRVAFALTQEQGGEAAK